MISEHPNDKSIDKPIVGSIQFQMYLCLCVCLDANSVLSTETKMLSINYEPTKCVLYCGSSCSPSIDYGHGRGTFPTPWATEGRGGDGWSGAGGEEVMGRETRPATRLHYPRVITDGVTMCGAPAGDRSLTYSPVSAHSTVRIKCPLFNRGAARGEPPPPRPHSYRTVPTSPNHVVFNVLTKHGSRTRPCLESYGPRKRLVQPSYKTTWCIPLGMLNC